MQTAPGFCVGLVFDGFRDANEESREFRWATKVEGNMLVLSDMKHWGAKDGKLYLLNLNKKPIVAEPLLTVEKLKVAHQDPSLLDSPNQVLTGPDHLVYVGARKRLFRFDPLAEYPAATIEVVIPELPGKGLHSLKSFIFDGNGHLYVNIGSASNVCRDYTAFADPNRKRKPINFKRRQWDHCPEVEDPKHGLAQIRKYFRNADGTYNLNYSVYAQGLCNSIALAWDPNTNIIYHGENSRDAINKISTMYFHEEQPADEINILSPSLHYGWPYCFENNLNSPEWPNVDCSHYQKPQLLLPAHAAPLGMIVYQGTLFPAWYRGKLITSFHGYEAKGHRIVTFKQDSQKMPTGTPLSIVYDWEARGNQEKGRPVGLTELQDGSVIIVEDDPQNKVLQLFYDPQLGNGEPVDEINNTTSNDQVFSAANEEARRLKLKKKIAAGRGGLFTEFQTKVIDKQCYLCYQTAGAPGVRLIKYDDVGNEARIISSKKGTQILNALLGNKGVVSMPPGGWNSEQERTEAIRIFQKWLKSQPSPAK